DPDPDARARLVWKPGMPVETVAVDNRPEASLTGGFVAFLIGQQAIEGVHVCEDGFAIAIRPATFAKVRESLFNGESFTMTVAGSSMNLVSGSLQDEVPAVCQIDGYHFQDDAELRQRIKLDELSWFDQRVGQVVEDLYSDLPPGDGESLSVYCIIRPEHKVKF